MFAHRADFKKVIVTSPIVQDKDFDHLHPVPNASLDLSAAFTGDLRQSKKSEYARFNPEMVPRW